MKDQILSKKNLEHPAAAAPNDIQYLRTKLESNFYLDKADGLVI